MAATRQTATGMLVGSVHYLAPELVGGVEATPASDQYALGVMAFELLTARKPLPAETPMAIALRHAGEDIPPPSRYAPAVPPALDHVIAIATARSPDERFPSVRDFGDALSAAIDACPDAVTATTDDGSVRTLILPPARHPTVALSEPAPSTPRVGRPSRSREWGRTVGIAAVVAACLAVLAGGGYLYWDRVVAPVAQVPQLVGSMRTQAQGQLQDQGLVLEIAEERNRLAGPAGQVIGQRPDPGSKVREGAVVEVVLSRGPAMIDMPPLEGRPYNDVAGELQAQAMAVADPRLVFDDGVPAGQVIHQDPAAGQAVRQGSAVTLTVSRGVEQVAVPGVEGVVVDEAEAALAPAKGR